jgi:carbon-monoxide dehydrogenase small subunit
VAEGDGEGEITGAHSATPNVFVSYASSDAAVANTVVEGLEKEGRLDVVQQEFIQQGAVQCGYCTPGMILAAHALLQHTVTPTREQIVEAISANICRCTGYGQIVEAVQFAADRLRLANTPRALRSPGEAK